MSVLTIPEDVVKVVDYVTSLTVVKDGDPEEVELDTPHLVIVLKEGLRQSDFREIYGDIFLED